MKKFLYLFICLSLFSTPNLGAEEMASPKNLEKATFAGGCFWCMESEFAEQPGIISAVSGYTGGHVKNPTYDQVSMGKTGHAEAVEITYDPSKVTYEKLLDIFWWNINPTTLDQQFADVGSQYRTGIFYHGEEQKKLAAASKEKIEKSGRFDKPIVTEITAASEFYPAEEYHQKYYKKNPLHYQLYKKGSGREDYVKRVWGKEGKH